MRKKKADYANLFTLRKDGRYQYIMLDPETKKRVYYYDRDPEVRGSGPSVE